MKDILGGQCVVVSNDEILPPSAPDTNTEFTNADLVTQKYDSSDA